MKPIKNDRESSFREDQFKCQERTSDRQTSETEILGLHLVVETGPFYIFFLGLSADM